MKSVGGDEQFFLYAGNTETPYTANHAEVSGPPLHEVTASLFGSVAGLTFTKPLSLQTQGYSYHVMP
jgi:hypothetical protein